ncbi:ctenidin-1-like [Rosa chinensis]|uniref:ctenidin-1-like n=1 Tax=Rosa chinensis TaxID=74649 RepID=UPI000D0870AF|nr:ctenidin-1-like [Rosa chinensis]
MKIGGLLTKLGQGGLFESTAWSARVVGLLDCDNSGGGSQSGSWILGSVYGGGGAPAPDLGADPSSEGSGAGGDRSYGGGCSSLSLVLGTNPNWSGVGDCGSGIGQGMGERPAMGGGWPRRWGYSWVLTATLVI